MNEDKDVREKKRDLSVLLKLTMPKVVQLGFNFVRLGPRTIFRSGIQLLRANFWTRTLSVLVVIIFDVYLFLRKKITGRELIVNIINSLILIAGATIGWIGATAIALQYWEQHSLPYFIFGIIGASVVGFLFEWIGNKIVWRESD